MESRLLVVCHLWPGITPFNVWDLPLGLWLRFADGADDWIKAREKASRE